MKHKIWFDEIDQIAYLEFLGDYLRTDVEPILTKIDEFFVNKSIRQVIIVMSETHKVENRETREESNKGLQKSGVTEVAFVGGSAANRMIARILVKTGIIKIDGEFFKNIPEAIQWLKSKRH
jgi:hypothetical protein